MMVCFITRVVRFDSDADVEQARMRTDPILGRHGNRVENEADYVFQDGDHALVDLMLAVAHSAPDGKDEKPYYPVK